MAPLPIVLLPGLDGTGDLFAPFASVAPAQFRPVVVGLPPVGTYPELLRHVLGHLPADDRFIVLGESFSGPLAMAVAREEHARVGAVVLCNTFVSPPLTSLLRFVPWSLLFTMAPPRWAIRRYLVGSAASPELTASVCTAIAKTPRRVLAERMRSVFSLPRHRAAPPLDIPVLVLSSTDDALVRPNTRALQGVASSAVMKAIPGPHLLLQAAPRQAWSEISTFLARAAQPSV
jgi:pimeloyl-ACP methyl ester carboxylesterase